MDDQKNVLNLDLLIMPSERLLDNCEEYGTCEDEEHDDFIFDPGPVSLEYTRSHIQHEKEIFDQLGAAGKESFDETLFAIRDELYEEIDGFAMYAFGLGGLVLGLAAFGCIPVDGDTDEIAADTFPLLNPWVRFYIPGEKIPVLLMAAQYADVAVKNGDGGSVDAYCDDVRKFNLMAEYL